jgi:hypothetical protein
MRDERRRRRQESATGEPPTVASRRTESGDPDDVWNGMNWLEIEADKALESAGAD